jgi:hypothetical protein
VIGEIREASEIEGHDLPGLLVLRGFRGQLQGRCQDETSSRYKRWSRI